MIKIIEKLFPDVINKITQIPLYIRITSLMYFLVITWGLINFGTTYNFQIPMLSFKAEMLSIIIISVLTLVIILIFVYKLIHSNSIIAQFVRTWDDFYKHFELMYLRIEANLMNENLSLDDELLNFVKEYHNKSTNIREQVFRIGEENLILSDIQNWLVLQESTIDQRLKRCITPFTYLINLGNPIANVNHHGQDIWNAIHISTEFIEFIRLKHNLKK